MGQHKMQAFVFSHLWLLMHRHGMPVPSLQLLLQLLLLCQHKVPAILVRLL